MEKYNTIGPFKTREIGLTVNSVFATVWAVMIVQQFGEEFDLFVVSLISLFLFQLALIFLIMYKGGE